MAPPFIVTSHGRSGTHWLARELNRSPTWSVHHERWTKALVPSEWTSGRAYKPADLEGDVDSRLRRVALKLLGEGRVSKVAVILRNPLKIMESAFGRCPAWKFQVILQQLPEDLLALEQLHKDPRVISFLFDAMVSSPGQVPMIGRMLGIDDLQEEDVDMRTTGSTSKPLPSRLADQVLEISRDFMERHHDLQT